MAADRVEEATLLRLRGLATRSGAFEVVPADATGAELAAVSVCDAEGVARLRELNRADPGLRLLAIGRGIEWFDAAFRAGADVWMDADADDRTVLATLAIGR